MQDCLDVINSFNPKYLEWYNPCLDLEHTIQVCRDERVKVTNSKYKDRWTIFST